MMDKNVQPGALVNLYNHYQTGFEVAVASTVPPKDEEVLDQIEAWNAAYADALKAEGFDFVPMGVEATERQQAAARDVVYQARVTAAAERVSAIVSIAHDAYEERNGFWHTQAVQHGKKIGKPFEPHNLPVSPTSE